MTLDFKVNFFHRCMIFLVCLSVNNSLLTKYFQHALYPNYGMYVALYTHYNYVYVVCSNIPHINFCQVPSCTKNILVKKFYRVLIICIQICFVFMWQSDDVRLLL